jgi:hypothetical protein
MATGPKSRRASFVQRFRVVARKLLYFQREVSELGPRYFDCSNPPTQQCNGPDKDPRSGCPNCKYTHLWKRFERDCQKAFDRDSTNPARDNREWPLKTILTQLSTVMRANGQTRKGYHPRWSINMARMIDIYRDEVGRMKSIDSWNQKQEMEAMMKNMQGSRETFDDDEIE